MLVNDVKILESAAAKGFRSTPENFFDDTVQGIWGSETRLQKRRLAGFLPRSNLHKGACGYEVIRRGIRSFLVVGE